MSHEFFCSMDHSPMHNVWQCSTSFDDSVSHRSNKSCPWIKYWCNICALPLNIVSILRWTTSHEWAPSDLDPHIEKLPLLLPGSVSKPYTVRSSLENVKLLHDWPSSWEYLYKTNTLTYTTVYFQGNHDFLVCLPNKAPKARILDQISLQCVHIGKLLIN